MAFAAGPLYQIPSKAKLEYESLPYPTVVIIGGGSAGLERSSLAASSTRQPTGSTTPQPFNKPYPFNTFRLITSFWISLVPSPMVHSLLSR